MASTLARKIIEGDLRSLARAATLVENRRPEAEDLLRELFPRTGRALILGITGSPGAGKSTFVDRLIHVLRGEGKTVAVIAVDPTSPYSGGAILGDRIRMQSHHADPGVFIRSMATRGYMGGLASATLEMSMLMDAAGRDVVIVETVGVGQDEVEIAHLADVTMVILVPGMGDDVQAIKAGIMEIADVFVINKADLNGADKLERELRSSQSLSHRTDGWIPPIMKTIASKGEGIVEALAAAGSYSDSGLGSKRLAALWAGRLHTMLRDRIAARISPLELQEAGGAIASRLADPFTVLNEWMERIVK